MPSLIRHHLVSRQLSTAKRWIIPDYTIVRHGGNLSRPVIQKQDVITFVLTRTKREAVVCVIQCKPIPSWNVLPSSGSEGASHLAEVIVLRHRELPAHCIPQLKVVSLPEPLPFWVWSFVMQVVDRYPCPLRSRLTQDGEVERPAWDRCYACNYASLVAFNACQTMQNVFLDASVNVLWNRSVLCRHQK